MNRDRESLADEMDQAGTEIRFRKEKRVKTGEGMHQFSLADGSLLLSMEAWNPAILHIRLAPPERNSRESALDRYEYLEKPPGDPEAVCLEDGSSVTLKTAGGTAKIDRRSGCITMHNAAGDLLVRQLSADFTGPGAAAAFAVLPGEDWVGFGDVSRSRLFHRGHKVSCFLTNVKSYIAVPFFMSTRGYGMLINSTFQSDFDMAAANPEQYSFREGSGVLDLILFIGSSFKKILSLYTQVTGRPKLPPVWSFGLWHICNNIVNARDTVEEGHHYRAEKIPCDVIGLEPGWMAENYDFSTRKKWHPQRFPLMMDSFKFRKRTFIDALKYGMGFHFELWLCEDYDLTYEEERRQKRCLPHREEEITRDEEEFDEHLARVHRMDPVTNPEEPWFEHLKSFVDWGADFFKLDAANQVLPHPDRLYGNGMTDAECHNFYPLMLIRQMWEGFAGYAGRRPLVFTPCGWTSFQRWAATWTGDTGGRADTLAGMLNTALIGHGLTTNDMTSNEKEGIHFGYLLPLSQINNYSSCRMPWVWGEEICELHRRYSSLRSRLIPYLYSCMRESTLTGMPLIMPLVLEFQEDPRCRSILHEYLLGPWLLVSIYRKETYFPCGRWKDFWTGKVYSGNTEETISPPADRGGGLFLREGAIVPFGPVMQYRGERPVDEVELYLFPGEKRSFFEYYEDDGVTFRYLDGEYAVTGIALEDQGTQTVLELRTRGKSAVRKWSVVMACDHAPGSIRCNGAALDFSFDEVRKELKMVLPGPGKTEVIFS